MRRRERSGRWGRAGDGLEGVVVAGVGLPDLGEADAAGGHDGEGVVVAVLRDFNAGVVGDLDDHLARREVAGCAVDGDAGHGERMVAGEGWDLDGSGVETGHIAGRLAESDREM